jgi:tRNA(fMet)-specific endonuclease VapC
MYLLDSDHLSILQRQRGPEFEALARRCSDLKGEDFFVSIISFHEQFNGWILRASAESRFFRLDNAI